jgi:hypothetical protein
MKKDGCCFLIFVYFIFSVLMATMSEYLMKDLAISVRGKLGPQQHSQVHCSIDEVSS